MNRRSERVWMYLRPEEVEYVDMAMRLLGLRSRGEAARFLLRLLRLIMPRVDLAVRFTYTVLKEEEGFNRGEPVHQIGLRTGSKPGG